MDREASWYQVLFVAALCLFMAAGTAACGGDEEEEPQDTLGQVELPALPAAGECTPEELCGGPPLSQDQYMCLYSCYYCQHNIARCRKVAPSSVAANGCVCPEGRPY